ncbi:hypothetical protein BWR60_13125 [Inquilinus limosus]|uniref:Uncharacterized protein n=1 Tax=Inquilinus limosus TaxID=171674 RepID=A0A211ZNI9_9PROT|nr:hypothetical protein BWR60_13125 [Inquilinus limosus]
MNSTIQSNITQGIYDDMNRQTRQRDEERRQRDAAGAGTAASASLEDRVMDAVMAPLLVEANRRVATDGKAAAEAWYVAAGRELGGQAGSLMPEYRRRVAADGQASAESWYVAAAGDLSRRYIQSGR